MQSGDGLLVPSWVLALRGVKLGERMVLAVLVALGPAGNVSCALLAEELGIGERTARRHLEDLDATGVISLRRAGPQGYSYVIKAGAESGHNGRSGATKAAEVADIESGQNGRSGAKAAEVADIESGQNARSSAEKSANVADIGPKSGQNDRSPPRSPPLRSDLDHDLSEGGPGGGPAAAAARVEGALAGVPWSELRRVVAPPTPAAWLRTVEELAGHPAAAVADAARRFIAKFDGAPPPAQPSRYLAAMARNAAKAIHAEEARAAAARDRERAEEAAERERERRMRAEAVPPPPEATGLARFVGKELQAAPRTADRRARRADRIRELDEQAARIRGEAAGVRS